MWHLSWTWKRLYKCLSLLSLGVFWSMQLVKYSKYDLLRLHVAGSTVKISDNKVKLNLTSASIWHIMRPTVCFVWHKAVYDRHNCHCLSRKHTCTHLRAGVCASLRIRCGQMDCWGITISKWEEVIAPLINQNLVQSQCCSVFLLLFR